MNYLQEIMAFEKWCENNYLPVASQLLWYKLIMLCNRSGWAEWVSVDTIKLQSLIQSESKTTAYRVRDNLIDNGLIETIPGKKGKPTKYKLNTFCPNNEQQTDGKRYSIRTENDTENATLNNKHKQKHKQNNISSDSDFEEFYKTYPRHEGRGQAEKAYKAALKIVSFDVILSGCKKYASHHTEIGTDKQYIKLPATWLNGKCWDDELIKPEPRGKPPKATKKSPYNSIYERSPKT